MSNKGKKLSEEHKKKLSISHMGKPSKRKNIEIRNCINGVKVFGWSDSLQLKPMKDDYKKLI